MITISIDVLQLDKARFKDVVKRDGTKAKYAELILIPTPDGEYGDFMVKQSVTKEERLTKKQMPILGNGKYLGGGAPSSKPAASEQDALNSVEPPVAEDDVPF